MMPPATIAERFEDFFHRQIALFERMAEARGPLPGDDESSAWEEAQQRQEAFARDLGMLEEEFRMLKREWDDSPEVDAPVRQRIREMAAHAGALVSEAVRVNAKDAAHASQKLRELQEHWKALRQGKRYLGRLHAGERNDAGYIDKKA